MTTDIVKLGIDAGHRVDLEPRAGRPAVHVFDEKSILAIETALGTGRPLLVRGEPGLGKSQLAAATAKVLKRKYEAETVHAGTEPRDLLYAFDAVGRLARAQLLAALPGPHTEEMIKKEMSPEVFTRPGLLWRALAPQSALEQDQKATISTGATRDRATKNDTPAAQAVVALVDEVDKADASVPNALLEVLAEGRFMTPFGTEVVYETNLPPPFIVFTTNNERVLPAAFVRRCVVLKLVLPSVSELVLRAGCHFPDVDEKVRRTAADLLMTDREPIAKAGRQPPGQAEYLDLVAALHARCPNDRGEQMKRLEKIKDYLFDKYQDD